MKPIIKLLIIITELLISIILFLAGEGAYKDYQIKKAGYGTTGILEWGGSPILWVCGLFILSIIVIIIAFGLSKRKKWAWIGSIVVFISLPILLPVLIGPPMAPAAVPITFYAFVLGLIFSFVLLILLFSIRSIIGKHG